MFDWKTFARPIIALSPMADMTDSAFCRVAKRLGAPVVFREMISAEEAHRIGLVNEVYPAADLEAKTMEMANKIAEKSPVALAYAKAAVKNAARMGLREGLEAEIDLFALCFASEDKEEGVRAFLEKRPPDFKGK